MDPKERINELVEKIDRYNFQYYQQSISEISDTEFDFLLKELAGQETIILNLNGRIRRRKG